MNNLLMEYKWKRPDDVPFPSVWRRFTTKSAEGQTYKIRIRDLTPDLYDQVWAMYEEHFYQDEDLLKSVKMIGDKESMLSQKWTFNQIVKKNLTIIAVIDAGTSTPFVIGSLMLSVVSRGDPPMSTLPGVARAKYQNILKKLNDGIDVFDKLNIECYFKDEGLVIRRAYRRLNIALELFKTMEQVGHIFNVPAAVITFNNNLSQALASKLGFCLLNEVKLSDYMDENGRMILPYVNTKVVQLCYKILK